MMSWDLYRYFLAVAESGSLSAAARQLSVSQPTVGRQIAELEARLETRLFERASHGYLLTTAGQQIRARIEETALGFRDIESQIRGMDKSLSGLIRFSATEGFGSYWLTPNISKFQKFYPNIRFELILDISVLDLRKREADMALRLANPRSSDLIGRRVGKAGFGLYGAKSYLESRGYPQSIDDLKDHDFIGWQQNRGDIALTRALSKMVAEENIKFQCNTVAAQIEAVQNGMGLFLAPHYLVPKDESVVRLLSDQINQNIDLWLLTHRDLIGTSRIRVFLNFLYEQFQKDAEMLLNGDERS
ncbi:LysR family transcriptional regulator [Sneathiella marina]|uniref:LysR family transcriptional regulator n=1 Tax=Sneathiella marina TaxID=2950108 RepID=A0ABY4VZW5_9PROT|nr:LysR family transcriptional regulator [Sneathiella marina]USG60378.1 LysR family transcriptional regulator [Sneathiella marina]